MVLRAKIIPGELWEQLEKAACQRFSSTPSSCSLIRYNTTIFINVAILLVSQDYLLPSVLTHLLRKR